MSGHRKPSNNRAVRRAVVTGALVAVPLGLSTGTAVAHDWDGVARCESGGNWGINTGNGYYGGLQFTESTWLANGGTGSPNYASKSEQVRIAENVLRSQGVGAWPVCGHYLTGGTTSGVNLSPAGPSEAEPVIHSSAQPPHETHAAAQAHREPRHAAHHAPESRPAHATPETVAMLGQAGVMADQVARQAGLEQQYQAILAQGAPLVKPVDEPVAPANQARDIVTAVAEAYGVAPQALAILAALNMG